MPRMSSWLRRAARLSGSCSAGVAAGRATIGPRRKVSRRSRFGAALGGSGAAAPRARARFDGGCDRLLHRFDRLGRRSALRPASTSAATGSGISTSSAGARPRRHLRCHGRNDSVLAGPGQGRRRWFRGGPRGLFGRGQQRRLVHGPRRQRRQADALVIAGAGRRCRRPACTTGSARRRHSSSWCTCTAGSRSRS